MARKTKVESARTRNAILDAGEIEMQRYGVSQVSLVQIAERAGVTRGAIYWHFTDKVDLLESLIARTHLPFRDVVDEISRNNPQSTPRQLLREVLQHTMQRLVDDEQHRRISHILLHRNETGLDRETGANLIEPLFHDSRTALIELCGKTIAGPEVACNLRAEECADVLLAFLCGLYETVIRHGCTEAATNAGAKIDALFAGVFPVGERPSIVTDPDER